jgi:hypothetical protein
VKLRTLAVILVMAAGGCGGGPNGSSDGRHHTCGYVTEHGVTEHLDAYARRCN